MSKIIFSIYLEHCIISILVSQSMQLEQSKISFTVKHVLRSVTLISHPDRISNLDITIKVYLSSWNPCPSSPIPLPLAHGQRKHLIFIGTAQTTNQLSKTFYKYV